MKLKAVIFDMDGVLIDSMKFHTDAWEKICREEKISITRERIALGEGTSFKDLADFLMKETGRRCTKEDADRINEKKKKYTDETFRIIVYEGIVEFILDLKKAGIKTAVVTGSTKELVSGVMNTYFKNLFDVIVTSDDVVKGKPHPEPYLKAVELLKLNKKECIVIENAPLGIESAKKAGIRVYALETTLDKIHLKEADKVFRNHKDLITHVKKNHLQ